jgi:KaiC/GvpD/RAD55 family RecA-like ATPase
MGLLEKVESSRKVKGSKGGRDKKQNFVSEKLKNTKNVKKTSSGKKSLKKVISIKGSKGNVKKVSPRNSIAKGQVKTMKQGKKQGKISSQIDIGSIKNQIEAELHGKRKITLGEEEFQRQRGIVVHAVKNAKHPQHAKRKEFIKTGIEGFDALLDNGIPKGAAVLVAGGAGSGKTIFTLQSMIHHAQHGEKCLYMSFEESEERLIAHMEEFGWEPKSLIKKGNLLVKRFNPFEITRSVDALLMKAKGELLIDVQPIIFPGNFKPDIIIVDSLTAIASAFTGKEDSYRIYIEQLFRFFEEIGSTSFLITETKQVPTVFSTTGVEEFLADAVVVLYNIKRGNIRERAIEVLKLRGDGHQHRIVAMNITSDGVEIYPDQEVFGGLDEEEIFLIFFKNKFE